MQAGKLNTVIILIYYLAGPAFRLFWSDSDFLFAALRPVRRSGLPRPASRARCLPVVAVLATKPTRPHDPRQRGHNGGREDRPPPSTKPIAPAPARSGSIKKAPSGGKGPSCKAANQGAVAYCMSAVPKRIIWPARLPLRLMRVPSASASPTTGTSQSLKLTSFVV